jgi:TolA-binding protein
MKLLATLVLTGALAIPLAAQKKNEIVELQRNMGLLEDQVRALQASNEERFKKLEGILQETLEAVRQSSGSVSGLQTRIDERLAAASKQMIAPLTGVSTKVDQMSDEFRSVREALVDVNARLGKLEARLVDLNTAVRTINAPPPPGPSGSAALTVPDPNAPPPGMSAEVTYQNALRDMSSGKLELAMAQFQDYLKYFGNTELAPNAQYYVADIHRRTGNLEEAVRGYDLVLEKYQENNKTVDARFMKAKTLLAAGQRTAAAQEFRELIKRYPSHEYAEKSRAELKSLGLPVSSTAPAPPAPKRKREE